MFFFFSLLILKSGTRWGGFYRFYFLWNWPCIYVCQESIMSQLCPLSVHQKHWKGKKSWERGWVIRFVAWLSLFDWNFYKKDGLYLSSQYTQGNNRRKLSEQDRFVDEQREWNGNMVGMYGAIYRFFTILLMYIYRKATKVQVKIVLKTSLEHILSTMILILIYLPRYFFLILVCLLMPVRKSLSVKLRLI